jgi:alkylated DNA repair dioxygenase AlkB
MYIQKNRKMALFNEDGISNLLHKDGSVNYYRNVLTHNEANRYFDLLLQTIVWENDEAVIFGKHIIAKRKVAWYGDSDYLYTYSNTTKKALSWTKELSDIRQIVEHSAGTKFNSCLLNLYHNGDEGIAWHSDDEKSLKENSTIASLSLGAERRFSFKHKLTKETISLVLEDGSLLIMKDATQINWLHSLPKSKKITGPRINLTFRVYLERIASL